MSDPFPPSPPPQVSPLGSVTSPVLRICPTACVRSSLALSLDFPLRSPVLWRQTQALPVLSQVVSEHAQGLRLRGAGGFPPCCLPCGCTPSALPNAGFRSSLPGLLMPLSTLHTGIYMPPCMTRGRCGFRLHRVTLSFTTTQRFILALTARKSARGVRHLKGCLPIAAAPADPLFWRSRPSGVPPFALEE